MKEKSTILLSRGFTMMEILFVIVILGILASIAVPRLVANKQDAQISQLKSQITTIREGIRDYANQQRLAKKVKKKDIYPEQLEEGEIKNRPNLFEYVISTPIKSNGVGWLPNNAIAKTQGWSDQANYVTRYLYSLGNGKVDEVITMDYCSPTTTKRTDKCNDDNIGDFICVTGCNKIEEKPHP